MWLSIIVLTIAILLIQSPASISIHSNGYLDSENTPITYRPDIFLHTSDVSISNEFTPYVPEMPLDFQLRIEEAEIIYNIGGDSLHGFEYLAYGENGDPSFPRVMADLYLLGYANHGDNFDSHKDMTFFQNRTLINKFNPECYAILRHHEIYFIADLVPDKLLGAFFESTDCHELGEWLFLTDNYG